MNMIIDKSPMNVILITLDDFSYELFVKNIESLPFLRSLKSQSVSFEHAFSVGPTTFFAFPGIIAGVYPYHFGIGIPRGVKSIDEVLKDHGYNTAQINHANVLLTPYFGYGIHIDNAKHVLNLPKGEFGSRIENTVFCRRGAEREKYDLFQQYSPLMQRILSKLRFIWTRSSFIRSCGKYCLSFLKFLRLYVGEEGRAGISIKRQRNLYYQFRDDVLEFINREFEAPQFLWIHTIINHMPYIPVENCNKFSDKEVDSLNARAISRFVNKESCARLKKLYVESLKMTDTFVGDIFGALGTKGLLQNSIVVITADHGEEFMEEGYFGHDTTSSSDRLLHVPLLFFCPTLTQARSISVPISTIDILPTICDLLGIDIPNTNRGISIKTLVCENNSDVEKYNQRPLFSEAWVTRGLLDRSPGYTSSHRTFTVRQGIHKLKVDYLLTNDNRLAEKLELMDWVNNRRLEVGKNRDIVDQLKQLLDNHLGDEEVFHSKIGISAEKQRIKRIADIIRNRNSQ